MVAFNQQAPPGQPDRHFCAKPILGLTYHYRSTCTGTTGTGFSYIPFKHTQGNMLGIQDLHKTNIDFAGKHRVNFYLGTEGTHGRMLNIVYLHHSMRIPHRNRADFDLLFANLKHVA